MKSHNKEYEYLAQLAEDYNIPLHVIFNRVLKYGWSIEKAVSKPVSDKFKASIKVKGVLYKSYKAVADTFGLDYDVISNRLNSGWSLEDITVTPNYINIGLVFRGVYFNSMVDLAKQYNIDYEAFRSRLDYNWNLERAITEPVNKSSSKNLVGYNSNGRTAKLKYKGVVYPTIEALAKACNIKSDTIRGRLNRGWSLEKAIEEPVKNVNKIKELAEKHNIEESLVRDRLHKGWSLDDALTKPILQKTTLGLIDNEFKNSLGEIVFRGQIFPTLDSVAKCYGLKVDALTRRLKKGWDLEKSLTTPVNFTYDTGLVSKEFICVKNNISIILFRGKEYTSLVQLCEDYNIADSTVRRRLKKGWELEKALTEPLIRNKNNNNHTAKNQAMSGALKSISKGGSPL